jgi:hypothetical protein
MFDDPKIGVFTAHCTETDIILKYKSLRKEMFYCDSNLLDCVHPLNFQQRRVSEAFVPVDGSRAGFRNVVLFKI